LSLIQAQQLLVMLNEIQDKLSNINATSTQIIDKAPAIRYHEISLRQDIRMVNILLTTMIRVTGKGTLSDGIAFIEKAIAIGARLVIILNAIEMASGPVGWLYVGFNFFAMGEMIASTTLQSGV
jgi:hypothetical protein